MCKPLHVYMLSFLLCKYLGMEWPDYVASVCLLLEMAKIFFKIVVQYNTPISLVWEL